MATFDPIPSPAPPGDLYRANVEFPIAGGGTVPAHWVAQVKVPAVPGKTEAIVRLNWRPNVGEARFIELGVPFGGGDIDVLIDSLTKTVWVNKVNTGYRLVRDGSSFFRVDPRGGSLQVSVSPVRSAAATPVGIDVMFCYRAAWL